MGLLTMNVVRMLDPENHGIEGRAVQHQVHASVHSSLLNPQILFFLSLILKQPEIKGNLR
jgi:hypothetical protein